MYRIPIRDIKIVLVTGYALAYVIAIFGPIVIDPQLTTHVLFPSRNYPFKWLCAPLLLTLILTELWFLRRATEPGQLYASVLIFLAFALATLPVFVPEFPHGNILSVGVTTSILSASTIFVWQMGGRVISIKDVSVAGRETIEYLKTLLTFIRQGAFAGITLFGALFFSAYSTGFNYVQSTVDPGAKVEIFLLKANVGFQIGFFGVYAIAGMLRYFFSMTLRILEEYREIALVIDVETRKIALPK
jgi:hypothetical protein